MMRRSPRQGDISIDVRRATSRREVEAIRAEWVFLRDRDGVRSISTDPDYCLAVVGAAGEGTRLHADLLYDGHGPRGLVIGTTTQRPVVCRLGYATIRSPRLHCLDVVYGGVITDGTVQGRQAVVDHLNAFAGIDGLEQIRFNHLPLSHECFTDFSSSRPPRYLVVRAASEPHWQAEIVPGSFEETFKGLSRKVRKNLRRERRILHDYAKGEVDLSLLRDSRDIETVVARATAIAARTYQLGLGAAFADTPMWRALLRFAADRGGLRAWFLQIRRMPVAFLIGSVYGDTCSLAATAYLPEFAHLSPGKYLHQLAYETLCAEDVRLVDYGFGDGEHKRLWGTHSWPEATLHLYKCGARSWAAYLLHVSTLNGSRVLKGALGSTRALRKLKKTWRASKRPAIDQS